LGGGKLNKLVKAIPVKDAHGDVLTLYEYRQVVSLFTAVDLGVGNKRLELDTGEDVRRVDEDFFELVATGERLTRIK
jgi:hypothetical protein